MDTKESLPLGKHTPHSDTYSPELLCPIERATDRQAFQSATRSLSGCDIWHAWELSWLNSRGKPVNAVARFVFDCQSPALIESKSFKLYLNSLAFTRFDHHQDIVDLMKADLAKVAGAEVEIQLFSSVDEESLPRRNLPGRLLDDMDIEISEYDHPEPDLLTADDQTIGQETLVSHLFRSTCPVTGQPDWASIQIGYRGPAMDHAGLLRYLVSWRRHNGFHEHCAEQIFHHVLQRCRPERLDIHACFTRRGGLDINPWRSTCSTRPPAPLITLHQ